MYDEIALPTDLNVNERILWVFGWGQLAYIVAGIVVAILLNSLPIGDVHDHTIWMACSVIASGALAMIRPYDRDAVTWLVLGWQFLRRERFFVWQQSIDMEADWGMPLTLPH